MKKEILYTFGGIVALLGSVFLFYLFLTGLNESPNPFLFVGSLVALGAGVFAFIRTSKLYEPKKEPSILAPATAEDSAETQSAIQKNNEMVSQYNKTAKAREQLRMLELANSAEKDA